MGADQQKEETSYGIFRAAVIVIALLELFCYIPMDFGKEAENFKETMKEMFFFSNVFICKIVEFIAAALASLGTNARPDINFDMKRHVTNPIIASVIAVALSLATYMIASATDFTVIYYIYGICSLIAIMYFTKGMDGLSKKLSNNMGKDRYNYEQEAFKQVEEKVESDYSVNIPMLYYYGGRFRKGWINIINPFRGTWVVGTPGSGKSFGVIDPFIRQHSRKGFSMVVYDYKFPTLAKELYYQFVTYNKQITKKVHQIYDKKYGPKIKTGEMPAWDPDKNGWKFNVINFSDVEYSCRVNPIQWKYIWDAARATETASVLLESLNKGKGNDGGDDFFKKSAENFLAAIIYFLVRKGHYENSPCSSMAHVLAFLALDYETIFDVLMSDEQILPLMSPFQSAYENKAMDQLEGMCGTLRVSAARLATKESYWVFTGDDFDIKVSDPATPSYLVIANDPEMETITGALNALVLNRLVTRVNQDKGKNVPCSIIVDELPTLYFHKIDRLIGTARSNKVAVTMGFQELPQLEADYGKVGMQKVVTTCGNVICGAVRAKETLEWISNDIFGKVKQTKYGQSIADGKTTISINENLESMLPPSKISDMPTGWLAGQTAKDFIATDTSKKKIKSRRLSRVPTYQIFL